MGTPRAAKRAPQHDRHAGAKLAEAGAEPVGPEHFNELKSTLQRIHDDVSTNGRPPNNGNRRSVVAHNPELGQSLQEWDVAVERFEQAYVNLNTRMQQEASALGIAPPVYRDDAIVNRLLDITRRRATRSNLLSRYILRWMQYPNNPRCLAIWPDFELPYIDLDQARSALSAKDAVDKVQSLLDAARTWPETLAVSAREQESGVAALKPIAGHAATVVGARPLQERRRMRPVSLTVASPWQRPLAAEFGISGGLGRRNDASSDVTRRRPDFLEFTV